MIGDNMVGETNNNNSNHAAVVINNRDGHLYKLMKSIAKFTLFTAGSSVALLYAYMNISSANRTLQSMIYDGNGPSYNFVQLGLIIDYGVKGCVLGAAGITSAYFAKKEFPTLRHNYHCTMLWDREYLKLKLDAPVQE